MTDPKTVVDYWFGSATSPAIDTRLWFSGQPEVDEAIREAFGPLVEQMLVGAHTDWEATPEGAVARLIVLDQFTRNVYRGSARMFAGDAESLRIAHGLDALGEALPLPFRVVAYLAMMHAEAITEVDRSVARFDALWRSPESRGVRRPIKALRRAALKHQRVLHRFGRYPASQRSASALHLR